MKEWKQQVSAHRWFTTVAKVFGGIAARFSNLVLIKGFSASTSLRSRLAISVVHAAVYP
jgi:hypothetical protein